MDRQPGCIAWLGCFIYPVVMIVICIIAAQMKNDPLTITITCIFIVGSIVIAYLTLREIPEKEQKDEKIPIVIPNEAYKQFPSLLALWSLKISDKEIKVYLREMSKIADAINKKDPKAGKIFCMRHSSVLKLVEQYSEIESSGIKSVELTESLDRIEESIAVAQKAFVQELNNMFKTDMLHIDAETEAYMQSLKNRGLIE